MTIQTPTTSGKKLRRPKLNPKQTLFKEYYLDPKSPTFGKVKESGIRAGYKECYARTLLSAPQHSTQKPENISGEIVEEFKKSEFIDLTHKNLKDDLKLNCEVPVLTAFGPYKDPVTGETMTKLSPELLKVRQATTHFVAKTLDKENFGDRLPPPNLNLINLNLQNGEINRLTEEEINKKLQEQFLN